MSEKKKPGLFQRWFGTDKGKPVDRDAEDAESLRKAEEIIGAALEQSDATEPYAPPEPPAPPEEPAEKPAPPAERPPDASEEEDEADFEPGPPETTPEWIEEHEERPVPAEPEEPAEPEPMPAPEAQPEPVAPAEPEPQAAPRQNWFQRLSSGLRRSSDQLAGNITAVFTKRKLDQATLDELEDVLIQADLGIDTAMAITDQLRAERYDKQVSVEDVRAVLASEVEKTLAPVARPLEIDAAQKPFVILMVGVNGSGKTTTIGKLAQKLTRDGKSVMLAAGDTFRAAAVEQLQVWGQRANVPVITRPTGADASGLAFDAFKEAQANGTDVLIIDTAGRLQNRDELMAELEKIIRVIKKLSPDAPHATLLTLDATTGQNALNQVDIFGKRAGVTGLVMTKLDGTARGGILVAIAKKFGLPVHFIGVGEGAEDLEPFAASDFARAIAGGAQQ